MGNAAMVKDLIAAAGRTQASEKSEVP